MTVAKMLGASALVAAALALAVPATAAPNHHGKPHKVKVCKWERHHGHKTKVCHWVTRR
ncbi:hypothetical protein [Caulobacter segnis]